MVDPTDKALEPITDKKAPVPMDDSGVQLNNLDEAYRFANAVVRSGLAPKDDKPETVMIKMQAGRELGFPPMAALAVMTAVKGRVGIMGVGALALCRKSGKFEYIKTGNGGEGDARFGYVESKRKDEPDSVRVEFSMAEARKAGLAGGQTYKQYPDDMLVWRAVSRWSKRNAADVLMGFDVSEVVREYGPTTRGVVARKPPTEPDPLLAADVEDAVVTPVNEFGTPAIDAPLSIGPPPDSEPEQAGEQEELI